MSTGAIMITSGSFDSTITYSADSIFPLGRAEEQRAPLSVASVTNLYHHFRQGGILHLLFSEVKYTWASMFDVNGLPSLKLCLSRGNSTVKHAQH